jgi:hypothetical protein
MSTTAGAASLARRFRRHADSLVRNGRSPLYARMMHAGADDLEAGGVVAELFAGVPVPRGSLPQLRLLAALHRLALADEAPELASFYPSAGGGLPGEHVWPAALATIAEHFDWIKARLWRTVQTNEPGRSAVLFAALLWLTERYGRPIRLLELGASAGLNLLTDRYCYVDGERELGRPSSPLRFVRPWDPPPAIDLAKAASALTISARQGCDVAPLDASSPDARLTLLSYVWPDELERIDRVKAALQIAAGQPSMVTARAAADWLPDALAQRRNQELAVVWHSLFRQYLAPGEWDVLQDAFGQAAGAGPNRHIVWLSMEPSGERVAGVELTARTTPDAPARLLARCDDHGPPVRWQADLRNSSDAWL